jgi:hypothetical protein
VNALHPSSRWWGIVLGVSLACTLAVDLPAQRPDTGRVTARTVPTSPGDTLRAPLTPRRAFLYSLVLPGYAQSVLGRHKAAALLMIFEGVAVSMIRESAADVREARRTANDSIVVSWVDASGAELTVPRKIAPRFDDNYVRSRRSHLEDWIAVLIANHLFAGADAYVGAHLWDVPARLSMQTTPNGLVVAARIEF